jgi:hypothetical protein
MKAITLRDLRAGDEVCGTFITEGTEVEIIRKEGETKVVIRGPGVFYSCNTAKIPKADTVYMLVSREDVHRVEDH